MKRFFPLCFLLSFPLFLIAQKDNSFKLIASMTGLGASYEYNPAKVIYVEGGLTTGFTVVRVSLQSKLALVNKQNFKLKFGVEGAYVKGNLRVGGIFIDYNKYKNLLFMPVVSVESGIVGIQVPLIIKRDLSSAFPIVGITLNVSKDEPAERTPRRIKKK